MWLYGRHWQRSVRSGPVDPLHSAAVCGEVGIAGRVSGFLAAWDACGMSDLDEGQAWNG